MKTSTAAFRGLLILGGLCMGVTVLAILRPNENNLPVLKLFFDFMKYLVPFVGGSYVGAKVSESQNPNTGEPK